MSHELFETDIKTFNAVVRSLEVIGEAAKNAPEEIRAKYPSTPRKGMAAWYEKAPFLSANAFLQI